jgi:hypothetical protein
MPRALDPSHDPDATTGEAFLFGFDNEPSGRQYVSQQELHARLSALIRSCEGCQEVAVIGTTRLDKPDETGCNWSPSIVLDPAGVAPEVYALAYASVIATARASWNLE